jgi:uncharacterized cupredoxin-like copper-binding protein
MTAIRITQRPVDNRHHQYRSFAADTRDTALNFSYQNITLAPGEEKTFVVRFT